MAGNLFEIGPNRELLVHLHPGQSRAYESTRRFVLVLAGTQGGKTCFGPYWLLREIQEKGQGDYLVVTPTFPLLELKALPAFLWLFSTALNLGQYTAAPARKFTFSACGQRIVFKERYDPHQSTRVIFGYATDPESLESATAKAVWCDEAGQKRFRTGSYEALRRRLSLSRGRMLVTTSLYAMNWVKTLYDQAKAGNQDIEIVQFESIVNPAFSQEEFEEARRDLPRWKFKMQYQGQFERPAGLVYDCIGPTTFVPRFAIPQNWPRFVGQDFGSANMAAVFAAREPETGRLFVYRTYHAGGLSVPGHVRRILHGEPPTSINGFEGVGGETGGLPYAVGGAPSEDAWRAEFRAAGLPTRRPAISDLSVQIDKVYGELANGRLLVFDDLDELREELQTYSHKLNDRDEPLDEIEDEADYHLHAGLRYLVSDLCRGKRLATSGRIERGVSRQLGVR